MKLKCICSLMLLGVSLHSHAGDLRDLNQVKVGKADLVVPNMAP